MKRRIPTVEEIEESRRIIRMGAFQYAVLRPVAILIASQLFYYLLGIATCWYEPQLETGKTVFIFTVFAITELFMWSAHKKRLEIFAPAKLSPSSISPQGSKIPNGD